MARPPKKSDADWMDALKQAMAIDPGLRRQRVEGDARGRSDPPAPPPPGRPPAADPPAAPPASEFPWEVPADQTSELQINFRGHDDSPPAGPVLKYRPPPPAIVDRPVAGRPFLARPAPSPSAARLVNAVEPLLQLVCRLNRMKRTGVISDKFRPDSLRAEFDAALAHVVEVGDAGAELDRPLRAFADVVVTKAGFPFARRWSPLTTGPTPPDKVFQTSVADALTADGRRDDGTWNVYYACLCLVADLLPAVGTLPSGTELLDELDAALHTKPGERYDRVCPQAYDGVFDTPLVPSMGRRLRVVAAASVLVLLLAVAVAVALNVLYIRQMDESIGRVRRTLTAPPAVPEAGR